MRNWKFIRVDTIYANCRNPLAKLLAREGAHLAGTESVSSLSLDMVARIKTLDESNRIILRNDHLTNDRPLSALRKDQHFRYCSLWRNGAGTSILSRRDALKPGNYFLCFDRSREAVDEGKIEQSLLTNSDECPYRYHVSLDRLRIWRNNPPYVNMDRDSDDIGYSSWDGNLVSWFGAGFTTRLQYAVHSGLFPEE